MIIAIDVLILIALIFLELIIIRQFWLINLEVQRVRLANVEAVNEQFPMRSRIKTLDYTREELETDDIDRYLFK